MAPALVISDASPLIGLATAGHFDLLRQLFGTVSVTAAVRDEILAGGQRPGVHELQTAMRAGWIEVVPVTAAVETFPELGAGEASTLATARDQRSDVLVLMDEPLGRARAADLGLPVAGVAGVLLAARRAGLVERLGPVIGVLEAGGFRISAEVVRAVLTEAGEG